MTLEDDEPEQFDFQSAEQEPGLAPEVTSVVQKLKETLTYDMALRAYKCRMDQEVPDDDELESFMDELVAEAYNNGYDEWNEEFLVYD